MCQTRSSRYISVRGRQFRVDGCMAQKILDLNTHSITLGCCCGHGRYPKTIIMQGKAGIYEYYSGVVIPRTRRFYLTDKDGYYYIPEISEATG